MTFKEITSPLAKNIPSPVIHSETLQQKLDNFPWWLAAMGLMILGVISVIASQTTYNEAFGFISTGLSVTITSTLSAFAIALVLGLLAGLGRISQNVVARNLATLYVELVRGIPMLVLIFFIALVGVPALVGLLNALGAWLTGVGLGAAGQVLAGFDNKNIPMNVRAITALAVTYGAFLAEIFRAGIQSIGRGQMEAARSQGMTYWQAMRYIILPQAVRNVLPALGNDFVSMLKDSSMVSVLAVRDITQVTRLYSGQSFHYAEAYIILATLYLVMTLALSFLMKFIERRYHLNERG